VGAYPISSPLENVSLPQDSLPLASVVPCTPADDARWFREEVQVHEPMLRAHLRKRFPALGDVDDVVQESYLRLLKARLAGKLRSAKGFLFTTACNAALDIFRHRAVIPMESLTENTASHVYSKGLNAAEAASLNQELDLLLSAMDQLPDRCRQILVLRRFQGLSHKEISAQLSVSENTIEKQVSLGLKKCHAYLKARGVRQQP
jgi:RNA polymerase sigma factor (sigma-70 family)